MTEHHLLFRYYDFAPSKFIIHKIYVVLLINFDTKTYYAYTTLHVIIRSLHKPQRYKKKNYKGLL